jgi:hypothetical protein
MSRGPAEHLPWTLRVLALPLAGALSVDRLLNHRSASRGVLPARMTYFVTTDRRLPGDADGPT